MVITFKSDVQKRKRLFTPESFAHPAKMSLGLLLWIVGKYSKPGETILDPMAGSGSTMLATRYGRNVVLVELEQKFVDMAAGYNCDGKIKGYKDVWVAPVEEGWLVYSGAEAVEHLFKAQKEAEEFYSTWEWAGSSRDYGVRWQEGVEGYYKKEPIPAHCGKKEDHEPHYVPGNWDKIKSLPKLKHGLGNCQIIQGDARNLEGLLADTIVTSPPYADQDSFSKRQGKTFQYTGKHRTSEGHCVLKPKITGDSEGNIGNLPYGQVSKIITSPPYSDLSPGGGLNTKPPREGHDDQSGRSPTSPSQAGAGKYDKIITSPPYEGSDISQTHMTSDKRGDPANPNYRPSWKRKLAEGYAETKRPYADAVITSPPYEGIKQGGEASEAEGMRLAKAMEKSSPKYGKRDTPGRLLHLRVEQSGYSEAGNNIGNLKSTSYLEAMFQVYTQCYKVLKPNGLMILVTKDFIRNKQRVLLSIDTLKLCERVGFVLEDWHERRLTQQSFWRVIYSKKHPEVERLETEDILVFRKGGGEGKVDTIITSPPYEGSLEKPLKVGQSRGIRGHNRPVSPSNTFWRGGY